MDFANDDADIVDRRTEIMDLYPSITKEDIVEAINVTKKDAAPGPDEIKRYVLII